MRQIGEGVLEGVSGGEIMPSAMALFIWYWCCCCCCCHSCWWNCCCCCCC